MKRKLILGSCVCIVITIFNFANMLKVDDLKLELLFDKIEALAAGETLPPIDVICSNAGWGRCWAIDKYGSLPTSFKCYFTGDQSHLCPKPF